MSNPLDQPSTILDDWTIEDIYNVPHCESPHEQESSGVCSHVATHASISSCSDPNIRYVCTNLVIAKQKAMREGVICAACRIPAYTHWEYRPL